MLGYTGRSSLYCMGTYTFLAAWSGMSIGTVAVETIKHVDTHSLIHAWSGHALVYLC